MTQKGYQAVPLMLPNEKEHRRQIAQSLNQQLTGKLNAVLQVTLTPSSTTTTVTDARIGANTFIGFSPLTANAAAAISGLYVSAQVNGSATLTHANNAQSDRTFNALLIG
jgi:hypothetical protein